MAVTYRTLGPWGAGKGANLQPSEVDANFYALAQAIVDIQDNPEQPNGIESITVSGTQMTIYLTDGTVMGPFTLPVLTFRWRGEFEPGVPYAVLDVFTFSSGNTHLAPGAEASYGIFMVQIAGTWGGFNPDLLIGGLPAYLQLFGSVDTLLSTLGDVDVTEPLANNDVLIWNTGSDKWINATLGDLAFQEQDNVYITGGQIHGMSPPTAPGDVATKAYVDALPAGMTAPSATVMANITAATAPAIPNYLTDILDYALLTTTRGAMLYRSGSGWVALAPGTAGNFLRTGGAGADLTWAPGGSGVTSLTAGAGIDTTPDTIVATGTIALAAVADNSLLANVSGGSAAPSAASLTVFLDHVLTNVRGTLLIRGGAGWVALAPGTVGYFLQTQGSTADPVWASPAGAGTVTSISAGTGISTGGAPITGAGTVSLAAIATSSVLANISGSSSAPVPATVSVLFDSVFGASQGAVLYRNATTWVMLTPGTSGQVLTTGGASANPAWANAPAGAPIANLLLLANISGSTAAPAGNTLSNILDAILGSSRGLIIYRGAAGWVALAAGTSGQVLTTGGTAGDPHWAAASSGGGASITVSDTPPASPSPGDAWWDSVGGQLYIRVDDGTSVQWVPASNQPGPAGSANMSGMVAGQIPIAATATTVTSSTATLAASFMPAYTGDVTSPAGSAVNTLATVNSNIGTFQGLTVNGKGLVTAAVDQAYATAAAMSTADNLRVLKAGDTMTAALETRTNVGASASLLSQSWTWAGDLTNWGVRLYQRHTGSALAWDFTMRAGSSTDTNILTFSLNNVGINTQAPVTTLMVNGGCSNVTGAWTVISGREMKQDIAPYTRGLDAIAALNPVQYRYAAGTPFAEEDQPSRQLFGLMADEVKPIVPEIVGQTTGTVRGVEGVSIDTLEPGNLIYALINAVKTLKAELDELKARVGV
jgi:hypothetical protein